MQTDASGCAEEMGKQNARAAPITGTRAYVGGRHCPPLAVLAELVQSSSCRDVQWSGTSLDRGILGSITRWSWEDRAAQEPWALWDRTGQRRAVSRGEIGAEGSQSSPPRPRASLRAEPGHSDLSSQSHISLSGRGASSKNHPVQPSRGPAFHPGVPAGAVQLPPCTSSDELSSGFILSLESASSSSAFQAKEAPSPPPVSLCPGQPNPTPCQSPLF